MKLNKQSRQTSSQRQLRQTMNESFRRNNMVISRSQKEVAKRQQSVTQRQVERAQQEVKNKIKRRIKLVGFIVMILFLALRMSINSVKLSTNASSKLSSDNRVIYTDNILTEFKKNTLLGQYWLLDENNFKNNIKTMHPEVEDINISSSAPLKRVMNADLVFRKAVFTWRDAGGALQFVDKHGVLFAKELDATVNTKNLINIEDQSGTILEPGNPVITTNLIKFVGNLHDQIKLVYKDNKIAKVIIPRSTREIQIQLEGIPYFIKFSSGRDLDTQIQELKTLTDYLKSQSIQPSAYIDIRISQKAFYK